jgi:hypothetical protein
VNDCDQDKYKTAVEHIARVKQAYRKYARNQTWEEKIEAVERMREASAEAKRAMREALAKKKPPA